MFLTLFFLTPEIIASLNCQVVVIFPFREDKPYTEVVVLKISIKSSFEWGELFQISVDGDEDDPFFSFELEGIEEEVFYEILSQEFEVESSNLTTVEKIS